MLLLGVVSTWDPFSNTFHLVPRTKFHSGKLEERDNIQSQCGLSPPREDSTEIGPRYETLWYRYDTAKALLLGMDWPIHVYMTDRLGSHGKAGSAGNLI